MSDAPRPRRRLPLRWLTLAELVGLVAVVIAGLGYWDSHRERTSEARERATAERERKAEEQAKVRAGALKQTFLMTATPQGSGDWLRMSSVHPEQVIQTQSLTFPTEVRADAIETTGNPRVEAGWLEAGLAKVEKARGRGGKEIRGRLPVGVVTVYIEDGQTKTDRALYLLGFSLHPRVLRADRVELEGLSLVRRGVGEDVQAACRRDLAKARRQAVSQTGLSTQRFSLTPLLPSDRDDLFAHFSDPPTVEFMDIAPMTSVAEADETIAWAAALLDAGEGVRWAIRDRAGGLRRHHRVQQPGSRARSRGEIGYDVVRPRWRQGVMGEVLPAGPGPRLRDRWPAQGRGDGHARQPASVGLLTAHGFRLEGLLRDHGHWRGRFWDQQLFARLSTDQALDVGRHEAADVLVDRLRDGQGAACRRPGARSTARRPAVPIGRALQERWWRAGAGRSPARSSSTWRDRGSSGRLRSSGCVC
jgi:RimJ/RimL family protein N-acetyltransferase